MSMFGFNKSIFLSNENQLTMIYENTYVKNNTIFTIIVQL